MEYSPMSMYDEYIKCEMLYIHPRLLSDIEV